MQKITPFLWFDGQAGEAAKFYTSIFKKSKILETTFYGPDGPRPEGMVMTVLPDVVKELRKATGPSSAR